MDNNGVAVYLKGGVRDLELIVFKMQAAVLCSVTNVRLYCPTQVVMKRPNVKAIYVFFSLGKLHSFQLHNKLTSMF